MIDRYDILTITGILRQVGPVDPADLPLALTRAAWLIRLTLNQAGAGVVFWSDPDTLAARLAAEPEHLASITA